MHHCVPFSVTKILGKVLLCFAGSCHFQFMGIGLVKSLFFIGSLFLFLFLLFFLCVSGIGLMGVDFISILLDLFG